MCFNVFFFFKQKTAYEMRISDWSSDVCSSDLRAEQMPHAVAFEEQREVERAGRHGLEIIGAVEEGGAVEIGRADLAQRFEEIIGGVFGTVEHQMLEQMGKARLALGLVLRSDAIPHRHRDDRQIGRANV